MDVFFTELLLFGNETSEEKHKEINRLRSSLFRKDPKVFELPLLAIFLTTNTVTVYSTLNFFSVMSLANLSD